MSSHFARTSAGQEPFAAIKIPAAPRVALVAAQSGFSGRLLAALRVSGTPSESKGLAYLVIGNEKVYFVRETLNFQLGGVELSLRDFGLAHRGAERI